MQALSIGLEKTPLSLQWMWCSECKHAKQPVQMRTWSVAAHVLVLCQRTSAWRWRCHPAPPSSTGRPAACAWGSWWSCPCRGEEIPADSRLGPRCKRPTESGGRPRNRSGRWSSHPGRFPPEWPATAVGRTRDSGEFSLSANVECVSREWSRRKVCTHLMVQFVFMFTASYTIDRHWKHHIFEQDIWNYGAKKNNLNSFKNEFSVFWRI